MELAGAVATQVNTRWDLKTTDRELKTDRPDEPDRDSCIDEAEKSIQQVDLSRRGERTWSRTGACSRCATGCG